MPRLVYLNGDFVPLDQAQIPVMDRGFLFGDGIYEVTAVLGGRLIDNAPHLARLERSLEEIGIANPHTDMEWTRLQYDLIRRNGLGDGLVYIEVTRGVFERDFLCPTDLRPTVAMFPQAKELRDPPAATTGVAVVTVPDLRWKRRDIKSVALLAQVLAKQAARAAGVAEAWMVEDGYVTEGASSTAFIIASDGRIVTRPLSTAVLPGITRSAVLKLAERHGLRFEERPFAVAEALGAAEAFLTSASSLVTPVVAIDGHPVGDGKPGPLTKELRKLYLQMAEAS
ncbi:MAG: D-amino acid aminotransferase [Rhodospirillales bacterium RIFCSPLOWO2_12_FULL_67_15]|nr:MAG: D-amino acid aminotransferase [Rhodospirillales bacterium RIFCSPLOWO2_12_FULL_67_15]